MAQPVVDVLQIIDVDQEQAERRALADQRLRLLLKGGAVAQPGQKVGMRGRAQRLGLGCVDLATLARHFELPPDQAEPVRDRQRQDQRLEGERGEGPHVDRVILRRKSEIAGQSRQNSAITGPQPSM